MSCEHCGGTGFVVEERDAEAALAELADYETENRDWPPRETPPPGLPGSGTGTVVYVLTIFAFHIVATADLLGLGWYEHGAAHAERLLGGEPWRAVTALTLHTGPVHVLSNAIFGALFGFSIAYSLGARAQVSVPDHQAPMLCPMCRQRLGRTVLEGIEVDSCAEHGTWFDRAELDAIVRALAGRS